MQRYKKKPDIFEAIIWTGDNMDEVKAWLKTPMTAFIKVSNRHALIPGLGGTVIARPADYIIRKPSGELMTCNSKRFQETYEAIND